jgi:hypothetical protein
MLALTATVLAEHVLPEPSRPTISVDIGPLHLAWNGRTQRGRANAPESFFSRDRVRVAGTTLGLVALPFAIVSWSRRERAWWGLAVCSFALAAIAWQQFIVVFAILLLSGALFICVPTEQRWKNSKSACRESGGVE